MEHRLRADKTCLNCRRVVPERFCTHCGQENVQPRRPFHYLFTHFVEDLVHYDSSFYKTVKALLFKPGRLTNEYLAGRRKSYVPPVKLYIFINFLTFFLISIMFGSDLAGKQEKPGGAKVTLSRQGEEEEQLDFYGEYRSVHEFDSIQAAKPPGQRLSGLRYWFERKLTRAQENYTRKEFTRRVLDTFKSSIPKALFLYLPVFAFLLWLFHGKKRWYYYDHGIFTLHYFSFLLLSLSMGFLLDAALAACNLPDELNVLWWAVICGYAFFYFFRAHSRVYQEKKWISRLKSLLMFCINFWLIIIFILGALLYSTINVD